MNHRPDVSIRVLGPMQVLVDGVAHALPSRRQRALLAALALRDKRAVSVSDLVDAVWDDAPPDRARSTLQTYVSRLRNLVGQHTILHSPAGYRLADDVSTDVGEVRDAVAEFESLDRSDPRCAELAQHALEMWQGPALAEFDGNEWFGGFAVELAGTHANLVDIVAEGMIGTARSSQAVSLLERSLMSNPLREPTQVLLVRALHAAGRTTEAVRAATKYRRLLRDDTGLMPGAAFVAVEQMVLSADPVAPDIEGVGTGSSDEPEPLDREQDRGPIRGGSASLGRPTPLIGRTQELDEVEAALVASRLVTVVGAGGVGKTRLVAEVVERAPNSEPVVTVELAPVGHDDVLATVGAILGLRAERVEVRHIIDRMRLHRCLIVLDNAEHVIDGVRDLADALLRECPETRLLVTSRQRLELSEEIVVAVPPLSVDGPHSDAVALFVDRIRRARPHTDVDPDDPTILELCRRLEGVPLALELTASRAASLGVSIVNDRFDALFGQLVGENNAQNRHASLGNVVTWSVDLLGDQARHLLIASSVFHGDISLDAVEAVGDAIGAESIPLLLGRLIDTSLVSETGRPGRFRLLEMVRGVARERLARSDFNGEVRRAHADWVAHRLSEIAAESIGPNEAATDFRLDDLRRETSVALDWAVTSGDVALAARIITALAGPLLYRPDADLIGAIRGISSHRSIVGSPHESAIVAADARAAFLLGDLGDVDVLVERALQLDDGHDLASRYRAEHALGVVRLYQGRFEESRDCFRAAVDDPAAALDQRLDALGGLALALCYAGDVQAAQGVAEEHAALADTVDSDTYRAFASYALGEVDIANGAIDAAVGRLTDAADRAWRVRASFVWGIAGTVLVRVLVRHRPAAAARGALPTLVERWRTTVTWTQLWTTLRLAAEHLAETDQPETALLVLEAADLDPAAPSLSEDDLGLHRYLRERIRHSIGDARASGVCAGAGAIDRVVVVERALAALRQPLGPELQVRRR